MPRIRTVKPEFFLNEQLACLGYADRLLFIGLWTQADKSGRLEDRPLRLKAQLFPYDDLSVDESLGRLVNAGLIIRYDGNSTRLIAIPTWEKHQRPHHTEAESVYPAPMSLIGDNGEDTVTLRTEGNGMERKGMERKGMDTHALRARFDRFWAAYPKQVGRAAALKVWERLRPDEALADVMIAKVREQTASWQWQREGGQFIPHPRTWLNQGRWEDGPSLIREPDNLDGLREFARHG